MASTRAATMEFFGELVRLVVEVHEEVAGLLGGPFAGGMQGNPEDTDAPGRVLDYGQDAVEQLDGEEVAGQDLMPAERCVLAELVGVALAPVAEGSRREAGEVLDVVGDHPGPARAEQLVEVLHGFGKLDRGTVLDAVVCELPGVTSAKSMVCPRTSERISTYGAGQVLEMVGRHSGL